MTKFWKITIVVIVVINIIMFVSQCGGKIKKGLGIGEPSKKELNAKNDSLSNELAFCSNELTIYKNYVDTQDDSISALNSLLNDCQNGKKQKKAAPRTKTSTPRTIVIPSQPAASPVKTITIPEDSPSRTENTGLCGDQYTGVYNGSHGTTINEESKLVYFISNEELNAGEGKMTLVAPQLNGKNSGKEFYWDAGKKLWVYESNTIITIARLLGGQPIVWCAYIGDHQQWGYPMFIPHEIVKTGSQSVRSAMAKGEVAQHTQDEGCDYHSLIQFKKK